jgi:hypothetical protein
VSFASCGAAIAIGCGSSGSGSFDLGDSGSKGDSSSGSTSSSGSASSGSGGTSGSSSGFSADGGGDDATTGSSTSSGGGGADATLDIAFPDSFFGPDTTTSGSGSGGDDGSPGEAGSPCSPDGVTCQGSVAEICSSGTLSTSNCAALTPPETCSPGFGCVVCQPGTGTCNGNVGTACNSTGTATTTYTCDPLQGETCDTTTGQCDGDCANLGASYIGCEYYSVTMSNPYLTQSTFVFSVSIANTGASTANINIQGGALTTAMTGTIAPGAIQGFVLPWVPALSTSTTTTIKTGGAYHIRSTEPVTVYQFNARDYCVPSPSCTTTATGSTYSYTNDASLLLPVNAMTGNYRLAGAPTWTALSISGGGQTPGTVVVIGTAANTSVTVTPPGSPFLAGAGMAANGGTVTLNAGDVLQIATGNNPNGDGTYGADPSGALITATNPVETFGGSACTYIPAGTQACDHIEQINFPTETLRSDYLVTLPTNQNATPREYVKIIGTVNGTTLTYDGVTGKPATVAAGGVVFFETTSNFRLTSSSPVEVAEYMEGQFAFGSGCQVNSPGGQTCGDPAMSLTVATAQFREQYPFTSPPNYYQNWANIIAPVGVTVTVTDTPTNHTVTTGTAIGASSGYYVANVPLCANNLSGCTGNHMATASAAFGIQVYGYGSATSYRYPGGLNLTRQ